MDVLAVPLLTALSSCEKELSSNQFMFRNLGRTFEGNSHTHSRKARSGIIFNVVACPTDGKHSELFYIRPIFHIMRAVSG
jgi:hypothetical protein